MKQEAKPLETMELKIEQVCKTYGSVVALQDAELQIKSGEIRAVLGGNGSGKSTIAKILAGTVKPDKGNFTLRGRKYLPSSPTQAKRKKVVMTSQELSLLTNLTVTENLNLSKIPNQKWLVDKKEMRRRALSVLEKLEIGALIDRSIDSLAASDQYMIEFAKALLAEPDVLIIDEITSALYSADVAKLRVVLQELREKGCIIIFISHRMGEIFSICDSVTVMRNGRTISTYAISEVDSATLLKDMTGTDIQAEIITEEHGEEQSDAAESLLKVEGLRLKGFERFVDLDVKAGDIIGITGLEGHGQSVLLRTLFGMYQPCIMELKGKQAEIRSPRDAVKNRFAFISGDRTREGVFGERSISDNIDVVMNQVLRQKSRDILGVLRELNVKYGSEKHRILSLSGGNQQKVVIGRWVASHPLVLLADDPTKGVDVQARKDICEIFVNLAANGSAVLMVSSDEEELISMSKTAPKTKVLVMYEGRIVRTLTGGNINKENISLASMQVKVGA